MAETNEAYTISYSEDAKGWPSFYSYLPDYMTGMNGYFYSWNGGNLYRHNTNALRNNYYGTQYSSTITSVFNVQPTKIKLFKTMSYESSAAWECTSLFTDLSTGSMLSTYFVQKEGEWFTFLRENSSTVNFKARSANGIAQTNSITGPIDAVVIRFDMDDIGSIVSVGDIVYAVTPVVSPAPAGTPTLAGPITAIVREKITDGFGVVTQFPQITVDCTGNTVPLINQFILFIKNAVAESHGARGYYLHFTLKNEDTTAVEMFAVGSSVMQSFP